MSISSFQLILFVITFVVYWLVKNKLSARIQEFLSMNAIYIGTFIGIASVAPSEGVSFSGHSPIVLVLPMGPQIGASLIMLGFLLQSSVFDSKAK